MDVTWRNRFSMISRENRPTASEGLGRMPDAIDHDSPWKEALDQFLRPFLDLTFPAVAALIDWRTDPASLEQEFRALIPDEVSGPLRTDKLVQLRRLDGAEQWPLIHFEVQMQRDPDLPRRLYDYQHRIRQRHTVPLITLAILGDPNRAWRPNTYRIEFAGCHLEFRYLVCKLIDFQNQLDLPHHRNNRALFLIAAHLATQRHRKQPKRLYVLRLELTVRLLDAGHNEDEIWKLPRLIDWLMPLPDELMVPFREKLHQLQHPNRMPYVTSFERLSRQEGRQEGLRESIVDILET
jgi:hypothetical protein